MAGPGPRGTLVSEVRAGGLTPGEAPAGGAASSPRALSRADREGAEVGGESGEAGAGPSQQHGLSTPSPLPTSEPNPRERAPQPPTQAGPGEAGLRDLRLRRSSAPRETGVQGGS